jgi:2-keto-4-pentenoate hydratase/2-oxohepta-3-ene-1,7-dioic acid hydratase in catechol pathway
MKLVSFRHGSRESYGLCMNDGVVDVGARLHGTYPTLRSVLEFDALGAVHPLEHAGEIDMRLEDIEFLPVIPEPRKIFCIGINYLRHREETGRAESKYPTIFTRFADTQVGHLQPAILPRNSGKFDFEGELAVVIGHACRHVAAERALHCVAGYTCFNDMTLRDWQGHTTQFTPGKNFPGTGGCGPWLVTADEIGDLPSLHLTTRLNGEQVQHAQFADLLFPVPQLIEYISSFTTLYPGDVIATGTPGGVGFKRTPPLYMKAGDVITVEIEKIGRLENRIQAEPAG